MLHWNVKTICDEKSPQSGDSSEERFLDCKTTNTSSVFHELTTKESPGSKSFSQ